MHSIEVWLNGELAAGEIGFAVGSAYTSLSGFSAVSSAGSVQLAAAAKLLERCGFSMWDLGMKMNYKTAIGATLIDRAAFLATLHAARDQVGVLLCAAHGGKAEAVTALLAREPSGGGFVVPRWCLPSLESSRSALGLPQCSAQSSAAADRERAQWHQCRTGSCSCIAESCWPATGSKTPAPTVGTVTCMLHAAQCMLHVACCMAAPPQLQVRPERQHEERRHCAHVRCQ